MRLLQLAAIVLWLPTAATAGGHVLRVEAIQNGGSWLALAAVCSSHGYVDPKTVARLSVTYQRYLSDDSWRRLRDQYQLSLHDHRVYSIAKKAWFPFHADAKDCKNIDNAAQLLISATSTSGAP